MIGYFISSSAINQCQAGSNNCDQICINNGQSFTCSCNSGYTLDQNGRTCNGVLLWCSYRIALTIIYTCLLVAEGLGRLVAHSSSVLFHFPADINECSANTDNCAQTCSNTVGSFTCGCNSGFTLDSNGRTCSGEMYKSLSWE